MQESKPRTQMGLQRPNRRSLGCTFIVVMLAMLASELAFADAMIERVSGQVDVADRDATDWIAARTGDRIAPDGRVRTGADGRAEITLDSGIVRLYENSLLRIPSVGGETNEVDLEQGYSIFDVLHRPGKRFEVQTPTVVVSVKGTRFGVDVRDEVGEVSVYRGLVGVRAAGLDGAVETLVREGYLATGGVDVPFELDLLSPDLDPWSSWEDLRQEAHSLHQAPAPVTELDRAKAIFLRATDPAILETAAERKPEIARRLLEVGNGKQTVGSEDLETTPPAAMIFGDESLLKLPEPESIEPGSLDGPRETQEPEILTPIDNSLGKILNGVLRGGGGK